MSASLIHKALLPGHIKVCLEGEDKWSIIHELLTVLENVHGLSDRAAAEKAVCEREKRMSTGLEYGIAIPHGKTDTVDHLIVAMGLKPEGVEFDSADGEPARIILLTLSPASRSGPHIRFMAEVSNLLQRKEPRQRLLSAETPEQAAAVMQEK